MNGSVWLDESTDRQKVEHPAQSYKTTAAVPVTIGLPEPSVLNF